jgi:large subunit ribosomal protein L17
MRHRLYGAILGRPSDERIALRRNLISELFDHGRIKTTEAKAKAVRGEAEKLITIAKRGLSAAKSAEGDDAQRVGNLRQDSARRLLEGRLFGDKVVRKVFEEIAPRYMDRPGGYTRILKLDLLRKGDAARLVILELVEE